MAHTATGKRPLSARTKRARKPIAARATPRQASVLPATWMSALARVKKHIQAESRHITHSG